jgi:NDP-sugar pyrophosphorylase family protein
MSESSKLPSVAILCGGMATRLKPISDNIPKALVEVSGKPFIFYQLEEVRRQHILDVVLCVGHKGEMIEQAVGDGSRFDLKVQYSFDGSTALGTGGALQKATHLLSNHFFVLYGDAFLQVDYKKVYHSFLSSGRKGLMTVFHNAGKWDASNVWLEDEQIRDYSKTRKTPQMRYIDYGLGILHAAALQAFSVNHEFDLAVVYEQLVQDQELAAYEVSKRFYEIGSHGGLKEFRIWLASQSGSMP